MSVKRVGTSRTGTGHFEKTRFRLGVKTYPLTACVCLYRHEALNQGVAEFLVLTPDMRFAHVARNKPTSFVEGLIQADGSIAALELDAEDARQFLLNHGEDDIVEDFPDLFAIVEKAQFMNFSRGEKTLRDQERAH